MDIFPIEIWFKIASADFNLCTALTKTFKEFAIYVRKNKILMCKTFGKIKQYAEDDWCWMIGGVWYRFDALPNSISPYAAFWNSYNRTKTGKPKCIGTSGMTFNREKHMDEMYYSGNYSYTNSQIFYAINIPNPIKRRVIRREGSHRLVITQTYVIWHGKCIYEMDYDLTRGTQAVKMHINGKMKFLGSLKLFPNGEWLNS